MYAASPTTVRRVGGFFSPLHVGCEAQQFDESVAWPGALNDRALGWPSQVARL